MLAFHAGMSDDGRRLAVIKEREDSLHPPVCIETVVKPPSYLAGLKTASIFMGPSLAGLVFGVREQQSQLASVGDEAGCVARDAT